MQASKRQRMSMAGLATPQNLHFGAMDFERDGLGVVLRGSSHDPSRPTFFAWLGVTQYLTRPAVEQTLKSIREVSVAGSEIVFTYMDEKFFAPANQTPEIRALLERTAGLGEPFLTGFVPSLLASQLAPLGFEIDENLEGAQLERRYYLDRNDGLRPSTGVIAVAHAFAV
jgi:methyltransferase (TIGR00027 family)